MKTLLLLRHAYARDLFHARDYDRPLSAEGQQDAAQVGQQLQQRGFAPDLVISSSAERAAATARTVAAALGYDPARIEWKREIYDASATALLHLIQQLDDSLQRVLLVGHNPGLSDLAVFLTGEPMGLRPGAALELALSVDSWNKTDRARATLR